MVDEVTCTLNGLLPAGEVIKFRLVWKKQTFDVAFGQEEKVAKLKEHVQSLTGCPSYFVLIICTNIPYRSPVNAQRIAVACYRLFCVCATGIPPAMMKLMYKGQYVCGEFNNVSVNTYMYIYHMYYNIIYTCMCTWFGNEAEFGS